MSISTSVKYVTLQKWLSLLSFGYLLFSNPTHKTEIGTANGKKTANSNPPGAIKLSTSQSETGSNQWIQFGCIY
jgi:hypothetical protein